MSGRTGHIKLHRKILDNDLYPRDRKFSRYEALIDLIFAVQWKEKDREYKGRTYKLKRGEMIYSLRFFAKRWDWSTKKVENFLSRLGQKKVIKRKRLKEHKMSVITVCKYNTYNPTTEMVETEKETEKKRKRNKEE